METLGQLWSPARVLAGSASGSPQKVWDSIASATSQPPVPSGSWMAAKKPTWWRLPLGPSPRDRALTPPLLANRMVELEYVDSLSYETVRRVLKKLAQSLAEGTMGHPSQTNGEFVLGTWKLCWMSIPVLMTPGSPKCVWMRPAPSC
jgi:hypothetical protein